MQRLFQRADMAADGGLGKIQVLRRFRKVAALHDCDQDLKLF